MNLLVYMKVKFKIETNITVHNVWRRLSVAVLCVRLPHPTCDAVWQDHHTHRKYSMSEKNNLTLVATCSWNYLLNVIIRLFILCIRNTHRNKYRHFTTTLNDNMDVGCFPSVFSMSFYLPFCLFGFFYFFSLPLTDPSGSHQSQTVNHEDLWNLLSCDRVRHTDMRWKRSSKAKGCIKA